MKKSLIIAVLSVFLLLAGCEEGQTGQSLGEPFIGGSEGITMEFVPEAPPAEVFDGGDFPFDIVVRLQNKGEFTIPKQNAVITISGVLPQSFDQSESNMVANPEEDLLAMRKNSDGNIIQSNPTFVEFTGFNHKSSVVGSGQAFPLRATACYAYGTLTNALLCSRKNILSPATNGICDIDGDKTVFNSGAPIQVTSLREDPRSGNKIGFTFKLQSVGSGNIYERGSVCDDNRKFKNRIFIDVKTGLPGLKCTGLSGGTDSSGYVTLFGNEKIITCTQPIPTPADFEFPVIIESTYDFEEDVETSIIVKSAGN